MTHDPLCPCAPIDPIRPGSVHTSNSASCLCVLIARVRADELRRPSEDGWMSVRAVLAWEDQVRADERLKALVVIHDSNSVEDAAAAVMMMP